MKFGCYVNGSRFFGRFSWFITDGYRIGTEFYNLLEPEFLKLRLVSGRSRGISAEKDIPRRSRAGSDLHGKSEC